MGRQRLISLLCLVSASVSVRAVRPSSALRPAGRAAPPAHTHVALAPARYLTVLRCDHVHDRIAVLERALASMRIFTLIDLASQADSLLREVREWGNERLVS
jgi:hypothetical protein